MNTENEQPILDEHIKKTLDMVRQIKRFCRVIANQGNEYRPSELVAVKRVEKLAKQIEVELVRELKRRSVAAGHYLEHP